MADGSTNNDEELRLKIYGEARSDLLKRQLSNSENADRAILSVSDSCPRFLVGVSKDIVPLQDAVLGFLPYISWGAIRVVHSGNAAVFFYQSEGHRRPIGFGPPVLHRAGRIGSPSADKICFTNGTIEYCRCDAAGSRAVCNLRVCGYQLRKRNRHDR